MPLEVRELVIKVTVSTDNGRSGTAMPDEKTLRQLKDSIISECMNKIIRKMKTEADR